MGALMRLRDWSDTGLGPISGWPQSLKTTVGILLRSPVPIVLLWGPDGIMIYNDAYSVFAGGRHPLLFGSKVREGWPEVADFNQAGRPGKLHAKVAIVDDIVLVSSANLTDDAFNRNLELGIMVRSSEFISSTKRYFESLIAEGTLRRL